MKIRPLVAWYDLWVGAYWDKARRRLYVLPVPCLGVVIDFETPAPPMPDCCTNCLHWTSGGSLAACRITSRPRGWCESFDRGRIPDNKD